MSGLQDELAAPRSVFMNSPVPRVDEEPSASSSSGNGGGSCGGPAANSGLTTPSAYAPLPPVGISGSATSIPVNLRKLIKRLSSASTDNEQERALLAVRTSALDSPLNQAGLAAGGAIQILVAMLDQNRSTELQGKAANVVAVLAVLEDNLTTMSACGVLESLLRLLKSKVVMVQEEASCALCNLLQSGGLRERAGTLGAVELVVKLVDSAKSSLLSYTATKALGNLLPDNPRNVDLTLRAGAVKPLIRMLGSHDRNATAAATALCRLLDGGGVAAIADIFIARKSVAPMVRLVVPGMPPELMHMSAAFLHKAAQCGLVDTELVEAGALPAIVMLLSIQRSWFSNVVYELGTEALCLMASRNHVYAIVGAGAVPCLVPLLSGTSILARFMTLKVLRLLFLRSLDVSRAEERSILTASLVPSLRAMIEQDQVLELQYAAVDLVGTFTSHPDLMAPVCSSLTRLVISKPPASAYVHPSGLPIHLLAMKTLYFLTMNPQCQARLVADRGTEPLLLLLDKAVVEMGCSQAHEQRSHIFSTAVCSVGVLRNLASNTDSGEVRAVASGALPALLKLLSLALVADLFAEQAAGCLRNLLLHAPDRQQAVAGGVMPVLMQLLWSATADTSADTWHNTLAQIVGAIRNVLLDTDALVTVVDFILQPVGCTSRTSPFFKLLHERSPLVQEQVAGTLKNLTTKISHFCCQPGDDSEEEEERSTRLNLLSLSVPQLVSLMQSAWEPVRQEATGALRNLLLLSPEIQAKAVSAGAIAPLVKLLGVSSSEAEQEHAAGALWSLAHKNALYAAMVAAAGAVPRLRVVLLRAGSEAVREQAEGALGALGQ